MLEAMREANLPLEYVYAYMKTKRIITEENMQYLSDDEIEEWNLAVEDYLANPDPSRIHAARAARSVAAEVATLSSRAGSSSVAGQ